MNPKLLAPILIFALTAVALAIMVVTAPEVEHVEPERAIPTVRVIDATPRTLRHHVRSQGTVEPRTEADLVAEVEGRILWTSPAFAPGGFFSKGDPLVRLDARDSELMRDRRRAALTRARSEQEFAEAELARQEGLSEGGVASASQLANKRRAASVARANEMDARAALEEAQRDLERAEIKAPFDGRIREENADIGQFVNRGATLARAYATDYVEIRLPIPDDQLAFLDSRPQTAGTRVEIGGAPVRLTATFAGQPSEWTGRIVRTEAEIDAKSRMVHVVARVEDPYGIRAPKNPSEPYFGVPLAVGLFVLAEIEGPEVENVIIVPRYAMQNDSRILVVDAESQLHSREVSVLRIDRDDVMIEGPLPPGEQICVSPVQVVVEGMLVRTVMDDQAAIENREGGAG